MANLPNTRATAQRAGTPYRGPTDRAPFTYARDVAHDASVPGAADTDGDSWRRYLDLSVLSVRALAEHLSISVDGLEELTVTGWHDATESEQNAGFGIGYWEAGERPVAYSDITWSHVHADLPASTGYFVALRLPAGIEARYTRVLQERGGASFAWPDEGDRWERYTFTGTPDGFDIYVLWDADNAGGAELLGIEAQANDDLQLQVADLRYDGLTGEQILELRDRVNDLGDEIDRAVAHAIQNQGEFVTVPPDANGTNPAPPNFISLVRNAAVDDPPGGAETLIQYARGTYQLTTAGERNWADLDTGRHQIVDADDPANDVFAYGYVSEAAAGLERLGLDYGGDDPWTPVELGDQVHNPLGSCVLMDVEIWVPDGSGLGTYHRWVLLKRSVLNAWGATHGVGIRSKQASGVGFTVDTPLNTTVSGKRDWVVDGLTYTLLHRRETSYGAGSADRPLLHQNARNQNSRSAFRALAANGAIGGANLYLGGAKSWQWTDPNDLEEDEHRIGALEEAVEDFKTRVAPYADHFTHLDEETREIQGRIADILLADEADWVTEANAVFNGAYPYGGWIWINNIGQNQHDGFNVENYKGRDYADADHAGGDGFRGSGAGIIWALPNNVNWSRIEIIVRKADGSVRTSFTGQSLRNAPSTITMANQPDNSTLRWSASSDTEPYAISNIDATDTIELRRLQAEHAGIWDGRFSQRAIKRIEHGLNEFEARLLLLGAPSNGGRLELYKYAHDYHDDASPDPVAIAQHDIAFDRITGFAVAPDGTGYYVGRGGTADYLHRMNLETGVVTRAGNTASFGLPLNRRAGGWHPRGLAIDGSGNGFIAFRLRTEASPGAFTDYASLYRLDLSTGAVGAKVFEQVPGSGDVELFDDITVTPDGKTIYAMTGVNTHLATIDVATGTYHRVVPRQASIYWVYSIAWSSYLDELVALDRLGNINVWDRNYLLFRRVTTKQPTVTVTDNPSYTRYEIAFDVEAVASRLIPQLPERGSRDSKVIKFKGDDLNYHPPIDRHERLATLRSKARSNLNGSEDYELNTGALGGGAGVLASSSNTLWISSRAAAKAGIYGFIIEVVRGTPAAVISRVFIPLTEFRTGAGSYVTGGSHVGRQGVFVGHWDEDNADSAIFAELSWSGGNLGIRLGGDRADGVSALTIHTAK